MKTLTEEQIFKLARKTIRPLSDTDATWFTERFVEAHKKEIAIGLLSRNVRSTAKRLKAYLKYEQERIAFGEWCKSNGAHYDQNRGAWMMI